MKAAESPVFIFSLGVNENVSEVDAPATVELELGAPDDDCVLGVVEKV